MEKIDGKAIAAQIKNEVKMRVQTEYIDKGLPAPKLACIIVEGNSASEVYVSSKEKACKECLMQSQIVRLKHDISQSELEDVISSLNEDESIKAVVTITKFDDTYSYSIRIEGLDKLQLTEGDFNVFIDE